MARRRTGDSWAPVLGARAAARKAFDDLVADALDSLPEDIQARMDNVAVLIEDEPREDVLGLYQGVPQTQRDTGYAGVLPDVITIYRGPLERAARSEEQLKREVRVTVLHEIAHHFGIDDERLHELGWE